MTEILLPTKLHIPRLFPDTIPRPQLLAKLEAGLVGKCTLVSAPAGSGKSTLLSQFVARQKQPVAWLSLDTADDDPGRFWQYLIAACQSVLDGVGEPALASLKASSPPSRETIPTLLINDLAGQGQILLILDDYHVIRDPSIHESMAYLLDYLPENVCLVASTRIDPPWPLARYRMRRQLTEIRAQDLRFSLEEAAQFLVERMGLPLSAEDVAALEARTEGWVAGLQLAALALRALPPAHDTAVFVRDFTGSHLYVADYLLTEILQRQPAAIQTFLLHTSILDRLHAGLCNAVTGREDGQATLAALHRANLFVVPLDAEGRWYRYHHLFADLLRACLPQTLSVAEISERHGRAAAWYEQRQLLPEAINHALAAKAFAPAASLIAQAARTMMFAGQARTLRSWLAALPEASLQSHPRLQIYYLWLALMQEKVVLSAHALREKEDMLRALPPSPENDRLRVELMAVLCRFMAFAGDTPRAVRLATEALARLPVGEAALRARAHSALAVAHWMAGEADAARQAYARCMPLAQASGNFTLAAHATMMMAMNQIDYGQLHAAARTYQSIVDMGVQAEQEVFFPAGQGYIGLAGIYLEWHELATAVHHLEQGMTLCRQGGLAGLSTGFTIQARLHQAQGDWQAAAAALAQLGETGVDPTGTARKILLHIARDDLDEAHRAAEPWLAMLAGKDEARRPPLLIMEIIRLTLARLFLAQGDLDRALSLLAAVEATAVPGKRTGRLIELYLLRALTVHKQNRGRITAQACRLCARALDLAASEGYVLLFVETGTAVVALLRAVVNQAETPAARRAYAQQLLRTCSDRGETAVRPQFAAIPTLVEALTPREMEVLQLLALGDSNQAIANKLVITVRTVKKHVTNILGKLAASNRTQAVARARQLGLLSPD